VFCRAVHAINKTDSSDGKGESWLTDSQLEQLHEDFIDFGTQKLLQANEECLSRLFKWQVDENTLTGEQDPVVKIIDFDNWESNEFTAINQFRIDTPGGVKAFIIPDVVLFVNGLPLVVIECKEANGYASDPMHEAIEQLHRYADVREETIAAGLKEGEQLMDGDPIGTRLAKAAKVTKDTGMLLMVCDKCCYERGSCKTRNENEKSMSYGEPFIVSH